MIEQEIEESSHPKTIVVVEDDGRVWVVSPSNAFGGYVNTFPKGKLDPGMGLRANALKEGFEESGLQVVLTGFLCDSVRSTSVCRRAPSPAGTVTTTRARLASTFAAPVSVPHRPLTVNPDNGIV